jgi:hypothetical protein
MTVRLLHSLGTAGQARGQAALASIGFAPATPAACADFPPLARCSNQKIKIFIFFIKFQYFAF